MVDKKYDAESIKILEGLEGVRRSFDVIELSKKIKKKGDIIILSKELRIKPRILKSAIDEGRVLSFFPKLDKSKAGIMACLRTDREFKLFSNKFDIYNTPARKLIKLIKLWNFELQKNPL
ncbi:MAG: hypothetical protein Q8L27_02865, partial [archaeon]|nr:hypothetical protein [archaeon]